MFFTQCKQTLKVRLYETIDGKQKALPRSKSVHLDGQPLDVIKIFVSQFNKPKLVSSNEQLTAYVEAYSAYYLQQGSNPATVSSKKHLLITYVLPYFISINTLDPNSWVSKCVKLVDYLTAKGLSHNQITKCNVGLNQLWNYLQDEQIVNSSMKLRLRKPMLLDKPDTPLLYTLTPQDVIAYARNVDSSEMAFLALVGYFFSLRTQESLALTRADFRAGNAASELECCKVMARKGLYSKFAVNVSKQKSKSLKVDNAKPKNGSKGWISCFELEAAKLIIEKVKLLEASAKAGPLVKFCVDYNIKLWRNLGIPGITIKDLRRASLYYLGHYTNMGLIELKSHARHNKTDTTTLYLRRPEEPLEKADDLDLEA